MATTNPSLFGMLGDEAAMQRQLDEQRAQAFAQQSQEQRLASMGYKAGSQLGRGIAGAFGVDVTDPTVRRATQIRQLASQFDTTTPEGMMQFAQALQSIDPNAAAQAVTQAQAMSKSASDIFKTTAEAQAKMQDVMGKNSRVQMLKDAGLKDKEAEGIASNDTAFANYVKGKRIETPSDYAVQAVKLGFGAKPYLSDYSPEEVKAMENGLVSQKTTVAAAGRPTTVFQQETEFAKQRGTDQAKALTTAAQQAQSSAQTVNTLDQMAKTLETSVYGGPQANTAIAAGQFLRSLNLLSPQEAQTLSNSEIYDKMAKDLVLKDLGGKLGAQISDADRKFIEAKIPQLQNSPEARKALVQKLKEVHQKNIDNFKAMNEYANKNGNLNNFDFTQQYGGSNNTAPAAPTGWSIKVK